jgi:hypothetical protein
MRHSDIRLTMNTYTHMESTDAAGVVAGLRGVRGGLCALHFEDRLCIGRPGEAAEAARENLGQAVK